MKGSRPNEEDEVGLGREMRRPITNGDKGAAQRLTIEEEHRWLPCPGFNSRSRMIF